MGLDMNLYGRKMIHSNRYDDKAEPRMEDGYPVDYVNLEMGYWRKHPDLHGYIVETFAEGVDECQEIELSKEDLLDIAKAIRENRLPHTEGFFFGDSAWHVGKEEEYALLFEKAAAWLESPKDPEVFWREVYYQASW
jgi:hypothetical protein